MSIEFRKYFSILLIIFSAIICSAQSTNNEGARIYLRDGWAIQSSCIDKTPGETISTAKFQPKGWMKATVPTTVVAAQVSNGVFKDVFLGTKLRELPGMTYKQGDIFNLRPMDSSSPYTCSFWYRTAFKLPSTFSKHKTTIHFDGINYRANIWINGKKVADSADVQGAYHRQEFEITNFLNEKGENVLALEIFAQTEHDLGINFVDWNPTPPDKNMGLWGEVFLTASGPVTVQFPQAATHFPDSSLTEADLTLRAELRNVTDTPVTGTLEAEWDNSTIQQQVTLQPNEGRSVEFTPEQFPQLKVKNPKLWWPVHMGEPNLHELTMKFTANGQVSDQAHSRFGIREITSELTSEGYRMFRVNGRPVLIRGGGWSMDMLLRHSTERTQQELNYVLAMNLNTIRMEAQLDQDDLFDYADEHGILVMAGWCCCDMWERWKTWTPDTLKVATASLRSQMLRLRSHPSLLVWLNGSDNPPPANVEQAYLDIEKEVGWPNPTISSASAAPTTVTGSSGVKMTGPYDYEPPSYWLTDANRKWGGAYGFNTETSPGPAIPVEESLRKFIPKDHLWPIDEVWGFHAGGERFQNIDLFTTAMNKTYGAPKDLDDFERKAQAMNYDGERAMFEAYAKNRYTSTGVIQWMIDNAWPSIIWHLWDYYLQPAGGYFGTRKACEPLHVQYSYDDRSVVVVNTLQEAKNGLTVSADVYNINLKNLFSQKKTVDAGIDSNVPAFSIPEFPSDTQDKVFFLKLSLQDSTGKEVSSNFYWLPLKKSEVDWTKTPDTAYSPIATFEDLTQLNDLPNVKLAVSGTRTGTQAVRVKLHNPSQSLAFQVRLAVVNSKKEEILPVLWDDNYISLMPGETREVDARYESPTVLPNDATVEVHGWNIEPQAVRLGVTKQVKFEH